MVAVIDIVRGVIGGGLAAGGLAFLLGGLIGMLRFPDFYTRAHAMNAAVAIGPALMLAGFAVLAWDGAIALRLGLLAVLLGAFAPLLVQALSQAAHAAGLAPMTGDYTAPRPGAVRRDGGSV